MKKILLSIKPCFVDKILAGTKRVEYRKRIPKDPQINHVLIYSSSPVKKIVAEFVLDEVIVDTPDRLWERTSDVGGISKDFFMRYFKDKSEAYAYQINDLKVFRVPKVLSDYSLKSAPQDYCYVEENKNTDISF